MRLRWFILGLLGSLALAQAIGGKSGIGGKAGMGGGAGSGTFTPTLAQAGPTTCQSSAPASTFTCQFTVANNTTNNWVVTGIVFDNCAAGAITAAFTDSGSNTYVPAPTTGSQTMSATGTCMAVALAPVTGGGGTKITVTATYTGGTPNHETMVIGEFANVPLQAPILDVQNGAFFSTAATPFVSSLITTTNGNDLVIACFAESTLNITSATAPFTAIQITNAGTYALGCEFNSYTSIQTNLAANMLPSGSAAYYNRIAAFKL